MQLINTTLDGNSAYIGGGIAVWNTEGSGTGTVQIVNSTLSGNTAYFGGLGGGIFHLSETHTATLKIGNSILKGGTSGENISSDTGQSSRTATT